MQMVRGRSGQRAGQEGVQSELAHGGQQFSLGPADEAVLLIGADLDQGEVGEPGIDPLADCCGDSIGVGPAGHQRRDVVPGDLRRCSLK